jgi:PqqD family protein of HPr-rel-A system
MLDHEGAIGPVRYRAARAETLRIERLDTLTLIYHRASGITHVVDSPVPELIDLLDRPLTLDDTLAALIDAHDLVDPDPCALAARLDELVQAGLVERG